MDDYLLLQWIENLRRSEFCSEVLHGIDDDHAVGIDMLHDKIHLIHRDRDTAAGAGLAVAEAVQEDRRACVRRAVRVVADVQAILIFVRVIQNVLAVFLVQRREILEADELVIMHPVVDVARPVGIPSPDQ